MTQITDHIADIRTRIDQALARAGRPNESVTVVGVSKRQSHEAVSAAAAAGISHFGENYLQEGLDKITAVDDASLSWHFVGKLQSNKTRDIAARFAWVETIDRTRIADRLNDQRPEDLPPLNVLIQLNLDQEPQKGGVSGDAISALAGHIARLPRLRLRGLMCMPPANQDQELRRSSFLAAAREAERLRSQGFGIDTLSMGMSADFELAIRCGSTSVRIGTALFGSRA